MWQEFIDIWTGQYSWIIVALMVIGMAFCIVEAAVPGFGIFGIVGIMAEIAAVVVHAAFLNGTIVQVLILIALLATFTLVVFAIFVRSAKFGLLGKSPIVENKSSIPSNYGEAEEEQLKKLIGKEGIVVAECRPVGKARIGDVIYEVNARGLLMKNGDIVKVLEIENSIIYVGKTMF